jgi:hypothetical protein
MDYLNGVLLIVSIILICIGVSLYSYDAGVRKGRNQGRVDAYEDYVSRFGGAPLPK